MKTCELTTLSKDANTYIGSTFLDLVDHFLQHVLNAAIAVERVLELMPD